MVYKAIKNGFRAIDTACQPKHYSEVGVGEGIKQAIEHKIINRNEIFIQTKYTSFAGQDPNNIPYNPSLPISEQVKQSFEVSLKNLHTDYIDSIIMHSPMNTIEDTITVWNVFEEYHNIGKVKYLGISNIYSIELLKNIYNRVSIKPTFIQNRFYKESGFDFEIRQFCLDHGMKYQSFWTLTANPGFLKRYNIYIYIYLNLYIFIYIFIYTYKYMNIVLLFYKLLINMIVHQLKLCINLCTLLELFHYLVQHRNNIC